MNSSIGELATAALDTLQGARKLPAEQAAETLREFLQTLRSSGTDGDRMVEATSALATLVDDLERHGAGDNDAWQQAIETMVSLVNEAD